MTAGSGPSGTTIHITMYRTKKTPPVMRASRAHTTRTTEGSMSRYSATPPATPLITRSLGDLYRRRFMSSLLPGSG
jgi:hypothetical protein